MKSTAKIKENHTFFNLPQTIIQFQVANCDKQLIRIVENSKFSIGI
jgi:hypothetical protein